MFKKIHLFVHDERKTIAIGQLSDWGDLEMKCR